MIDEATVRNRIQQHRVCWECAPLIEMRERSRVPIGFEMHLFGRHSAQATLTQKGFSDAQALYQKLKEIALFALPKDVRPSRYEIDEFRATIYFRPESGSVPEIQLTVRVLHREGYFDSIDDCETRCANEIQARLRALGARQNAWAGEDPNPGRKSS